MTAALEQMRALALEMGLGQAAIERLDAARRRLAAEAFRVAVAGERGAGKSLFVNALLGAGVLPCASQPCTAVPTRIVWGEAPATAVLLRQAPEAGGGSRAVAVRELTPFITRLQPAFAARAAAVVEAVVHSPVPFLHESFELLDLPGLDPEPAPETPLGEVHAVLLTLAVDGLVSDRLGDEAVRLLREDVGWIGLVVTKLDRLPSGEWDGAIHRAAERFREGVERRLGEAPAGGGEAVLGRLSEIEVFGVSARQALQAKLAGDGILRAGSGMDRLESWLSGLGSGGREEVLRRIAASAIGACGREALWSLERTDTARGARRGSLAEVHRAGTLLFEGLQGMACEEMKRIDAAALRAGTEAKRLADALPERLREAVLHAVAKAPLAETELDGNGSGEREERFARRVSSAVARTVRRVAEEIQMEAQEERMAALAALAAFAVTCDRLTEHMAARISQAEGPALPPLADFHARLGQLWLKDRKAAERYAARKRITTPSLAFGAGRIAACLAPPAVPAVAAPAVEGPPGSGRVGAWKTAYRAAVLARLEPELQAWRAAGESELASWLANGFEALKGEIGERLARSRVRLDEVCGLPGPAGDPDGVRARIEEIVQRARGG